jgi:septal ring factor EnvC (AmiA/AmiB activator)
VEGWVSVISTLGFPIACVLAMGIFIYRIYQDMKHEKETAREENKANMEQVQARCKDREDKLYTELAKSQEVNREAIETIAKYAEKLDVIQKDIGEIKTDITIIKAQQ